MLKLFSNLKVCLIGEWSITGYVYTSTLFSGAVATSAPVVAELNFKSYLEVVSASLRTTSYGETCTDNIAGATSKIQSMLTSDEGRQQLSKIFRFAI